MTDRITKGLIVALLIASIGLPVASFGQQAEEYALKASYLARFMRFVNWPENKRMLSSTPFVICVVGENPFGNSLEDVFAQRESGDREVRINYISQVDDDTNCDLLFIADSEEETLEDILMQVSGKPILTIGDAAEFSQAGVIINFYVDGAKLHFEINLKAARLSDLEFDPFLLDYARITDSLEAPDDES